LGLNESPSGGFGTSKGSAGGFGTAQSSSGYGSSNAWSNRNTNANNGGRSTANSLMLYGHPGSRSPLVNWAALELGVKLAMGDLVDNPHPFGKLPCMTDQQGEIGIFESGAILQYLQDNYYDDRYNQPLSLAQSAALASWIVWANASLEPICLLSAEDGSIKGTRLQEPARRQGRTGSTRSKNLKEIDRLDDILGNLSRDQRSSSSPSSAFLLGNQFTLADVAVASYLLFALRFFPETDLSIWPNIVAYLSTCASRQAYGEAFGRDIQSSLLNNLRAMNNSRGGDRNINRGHLSSNSLTLYGHSSSVGSPAVNWACFELGLDLVAGDLSMNPHPFGKIPCLTDNNGEIMVFESGAILQYLLDNYQSDSVGNMNMNEFRRTTGSSAKESAEISSWIVWANAQLEPICCSQQAAPQQRQPAPSEFYGRPGVKFDALDELDDLLGQKQRQLQDQFSSIFLVGDKFTLADVSVASYLLYIPQHFPGADLAHWPHLVSYMKDCALRQGFSAAFGTGAQGMVLDELDYSFSSSGGRSNRGSGSMGGGSMGGGSMRGGSMPSMKPAGPVRSNDRRTDRSFVFDQPNNYGDSGRRSRGNAGTIGPDQLIQPLTPRY